jgi:hypothetical protein
MSWTANARGRNESGIAHDHNPVNTMTVFTDTVTLGAGLLNRYTSVIDFIPTDNHGRQLGFTVVSNTGTTNLSGSASDQLYASYTRAGTYFQVKDTLRDCNYADDTNQGTSYRDIDNAMRIRYVDPSFIGQFPYYKIRALQAAVESSSKTIGFAVTVGAPKSALKSWEVARA